MKPTCVIYAPIDVYSGYSANSRDKVKAIIESKKNIWDIKIFSCRWGTLPHGFIDDHLEEWGFLKNYISEEKLTSKPDYMFWITIPSEAKPIGKWNCLITAGIETTIASNVWIEHINQMDLTIVSSQHSKNVFLNSKYDKFDSKTNTKLGELKIEKPIEVLFEGGDLNKYKTIKTSNLNLDFIKENFIFLCVGHWIGNSPMGEDRKNIGLTIKTFLETFKNKPNPPALLLKVSKGGSSYMDREEISKLYYNISKQVGGNLPNVYLLHGELSDNEMNQLYNHPKIKCLISLTKGEGFGRPLLEFSMIGKPILVSDWSGHMDFLKPEFNLMFRGELKQVHPTNCVKDTIIPESKWFNPNTTDVMNYMVDIRKNYKKYLELAKKQKLHSRTNFSWDEMYKKFNQILNEYIPNIPQKIELKLPKIETFKQIKK